MKTISEKVFVYSKNNEMFEFSGKGSSLIKLVQYDSELMELTIYFNNYYRDSLVYKNVEKDVFIDFMGSISFGKFYLSRIKNRFNLKKQDVMADKVIKLKIDVNKIKKEWLFVGEKGVYLNLTVLYNEEQDKYETNGLVIQDVPNEIYKQDKSQRGPILGNCKEYGAKPRLEPEAVPGTESGKLGASDDIADDLPF